MSAGNFFAGILLLFYAYYLTRAIAGNRQGWFFASVSSTNALVFNAVLINDSAATLIYFWLTFVQESALIGRSIILWLAHLAISGMILGQFINEDDGRYGFVARPALFLLGLYWYYLAVGPGVTAAEILDTIGDFLDS